jgi:hypothetical protein
MFIGKDNQDYHELRGVLPGVAVTKGEAVQHNDVFGFYFNDETDTTKPVVIVYKMRQVLADKAVGTGEAIEEGDRVYYFPATELVSANPGTTVGTDYYYCGTCKKAATGSDTTVLIRFDGELWDIVA